MCSSSGSSVDHGLDLVATQLEGVVHRAHGDVDVAVAADDGDADLRGADQLEVDPGVGQGAEEPRGDAGVRPHARPDQRHLADVLVEADVGVADGVLDLLQRGQRRGAVALGQREGDVGELARLGRHVLHDHVDVDLGVGEDAEELRRLARPVRHAVDGDLALAPVVRDAGDDRLFHREVLHRAGHDRAGELGVGAAHVHGDAVAAGGLDAAEHEHLGAGRGELEHLLVGDGRQPLGVGHDPRVGGEDAVDVGVDLADVGLQRGRDGDRGGVRAAPAQRGDVLGVLADALEAGDDDDRALVQRLPQPARGDVDDPRLAVAGRGDDARLRAGERARLVAVRGDRYRQQRHRDPLARGQQHVQLAAGRGVGDLAGLVEQLVGRVAHRGDHDDDVVAVLLGSHDPLGDALDVRRSRYGGTTVLLDDQGHGSTGYRRRVDDPAQWLLSAEERGNDATALPAWTTGNLARPLVHGATYFDRLVEEVEALEAGDQLFFTDWRGDPDEQLREGGPTVAELFSAAISRGVCVRGLVWRSHWDKLSFSKAENRALDVDIEHAGGEVILDQRVRRGGSHHQKFVVLRHAGDPSRDVAFAGGIDLCHSRRDDDRHAGDPQPQPMAEAYGPRPPWHDVQLELRGPTVGVLDTVFRERWDDPTSADVDHPIAWVRDKLPRSRLQGDPLPPELPAPPECGPHVVQQLRTYAAIRPPYDFAPDGERSVARGYSKAIRRARRLVYLEDQYMWSADVARLFARALTDQPDLHLVVVVPRIPDQDGAFAERPQYVGRWEAIEMCRRAGRDRVHVFDVENHEGTPVYVHAKVCVVDDVWASVGSDNFNRRSWTHDSELSSAVLDTTRDPREPRDPAGTGEGARVFARDLRLELAREHLDRAPDGSEDGDLLDPARFVTALNESATALQAWHDGGRQGPRPPGRLRPHRPERLSPLPRAGATPLYRLVDAPDGRPLRQRLRHEF